MMLSRIADNMFWLNRYMERVDGLSRSMRYFYILLLDEHTGPNTGYAPLLQCFTTLGKSQIEAMAFDTPAVLTYLATDESNINSLRVILGKARENARGSQDKITKEVWEQVNSMYHYINGESIPETLKGPDALRVLDKLEKNSLLYNGIVDSTMPRGLGWEFMNVGKHIERCLQTVSLVDAYLEPVGYNLDQKEDLVYWRQVLLALSGYELYLKTNRGTAHTRQTVCQVIFNKDFPRSVLYSLERMEKYLEKILEQNPDSASMPLAKQFGRLKSLVEFTDSTNMDGEELRILLDNIQQQIWDFSAHLSRLFFSYS
jgi:uncharacterized alpha-E superfamily protein